MPMEGTPIAFEWQGRRHTIFSTGHAQIWSLGNYLSDLSDDIRTLPHFASPIAINPSTDDLLGVQGLVDAFLPSLPDSPFYSTGNMYYKGELDFTLTSPNGLLYNYLSSDGKDDAFFQDWEIFSSLKLTNGWYTKPDAAEPMDWWDRSQYVWPSGTTFWKHTYNGTSDVAPIEGKNFMLAFNHAEQANIIGHMQNEQWGSKLLPYGEWVLDNTGEPFSTNKWAYGIGSHYKYNMFFFKYGYDVEWYHEPWNWYFPFREIDVFDAETYGYSFAWPPYRDSMHYDSSNDSYDWWNDGQFGTSWTEYLASVSINVVNFTSDGEVAGSLDFGPVVWPGSGYLVEVDYQNKEYTKLTHGVSSPTCVRDGNDLYLFYVDSGTQLKVAKSDISGLLSFPGNNVGGGAGSRVWDFEVYSSDDINGDPVFSGSPLPAGFEYWLDNRPANQEQAFADYVAFLATPPEEPGIEVLLSCEDGNSFTNQWSIRHNWYSESNPYVTPTQISAHQDGEYAWVSSSWDGTILDSDHRGPFAIAKIKNSDYWVSVSTYTIEETNVWVWDVALNDYVYVAPSINSHIFSVSVSDDLVHWSEGRIINNDFPNNRAPGFTPSSSYARLMNADGSTTEEVDADEFYIISTLGDEVLRIPLSIEIDDL